MEGIDIYRAYQRLTSASAVRQSGRRFCYIKVSDGRSTRSDGGYAAALKQAGVSVGGYHYAQPGDPVAQANLLIERCRATGALDLAPCLDLESPFVPNRTAVNFAVAFCRQVKARGYRPCLYGNNTMMRTLRSAVRAAVPSTIIWVARYGASPSVAFEVWQYSQSGHVPGIAAGSVDLDRGVIPLNVATAPKAAAKPKPQPGWIEAMAFTDTFVDWAKNRQSVQGWMNLQDKGRWDILNRIKSMPNSLWDKQLPNPWYRKDDPSGLHQSYKAWDWTVGANLKADQCNRKLDQVTKQVAALQQKLDTLTDTLAAQQRPVPTPREGGEQR